MERTNNGGKERKKEYHVDRMFGKPWQSNVLFIRNIPHRGGVHKGLPTVIVSVCIYYV